MRTITCTVGAERAGQPVWQVLREELGVSDRGLRRAKRVPGAVLLDGAPTRTAARVRAGQTVGIAVDDATVARDEPAVEPQPGPLAIIYEDDDLLVVDKPAGLVVHPCSGQRSGTLSNFAVHHLATRGHPQARPHPVHRLDVGTSGLIVFATSGFVQSRLQEQLHGGGFARTYLALCRGALAQDAGTVDRPIARVGDGPRSHDVADGGKRAVTRYRVLARLDAGGVADGAASLVALELETGRTHQIRAHMAFLGHPLLGDAAYGGACADIARPALHSWRLRLEHPLTGAPLDLEAPLPADMRALLAPRSR